MASASSSKTLLLKSAALQVIIDVAEDGVVRLQHVLPTGVEPKPSASPFFESPSSLPICDVRLSGEGNTGFKTSKSLVGSYIGQRLKYKSHREEAGRDGAGSKTLHIEMVDAVTEISVTSHLTVFDDLPFLRSSATVRNDSANDVIVSQLSSLNVGGMTRAREWWNEYVVSMANNTWFREAQWRDQSLPDLGIDDFGIYDTIGDDHHQSSLTCFSLSNRGTFSTQGHLPMGMLKRRDNSETWLWQIESSGSWRWDIGDFEDNVYVALSGPNGNDHEWREKLSPGGSFTSVTAAVCHIYGDADRAFGDMTRYRRRIRRKHADTEELPIIFNDYMNCLMGDPTDEKILALVGPVAAAGAEYFVIDSGWYADSSGWWDDVGEWEPSKKRFPMGFRNLLEKIKEAGLKPGLWVEPEVVGERSVIAKTLPPEAFFQRDGKRVVEKRRYQLDYRHPAVIKRMDEVIDKLVTVYGAKYFKFDYNVEITSGTDIDCFSPGAGQLGHNRAYLSWVAGLLDRYPGLVIENCSSGAQRMDYAMLATHTLQSTSDQQDPVKYAAISAAIHTAVTPEQGATWAYPQAEWSDEVNAMTVVNSLLGRIHLSGRLDQMKGSQLELIHEGMRVYKDIRGDIATSLPFWPLGLPAWHDEWLALGLSAENGRKHYVAVWRRGGGDTCTLPIKSLSGRDASVQLLYPAKLGAEASWDGTTSALKVTLPKTVCARLFCLTTE